jgi:hypothetical protein
VADPVGLEALDNLGDLLDRPRLADMNRDSQAQPAGTGEEVAVVGDAEGLGPGRR